MKRKLYHPLWTHLTAFGLLGMQVYAATRISDFQAKVPVHFGPSGKANSWGTPLSVFIPLALLCLGFVALGVLLDELWARQEHKKSFNWLAPLDDVFLGLMTGVLLGQVEVWRSGSEILGNVWPMVGAWVLVGLVGACLLEMLRPHIPGAPERQPEDVTLLKQQLYAATESGAKWVYVETQNPWWLNLIMVISSLGMLLGMAAMYQAGIVAMAIMFALLSLFMWLFIGGLRVLVDPSRVRVSFGILGIKVLEVPFEDLVSAEKRRFSPLKDFGGYGFRKNREMSAYYFSGNEGVVLTTAKGKKYLVGSNHPERLEVAISTGRSLHWS